jgi:hypothetical protein
MFFLLLMVEVVERWGLPEHPQLAFQVQTPQEAVEVEVLTTLQLLTLEEPETLTQIPLVKMEVMGFLLQAALLDRAVAVEAWLSLDLTLH